MKIFSKTVVHKLDDLTMKYEGVSSSGLMERASKSFVDCFIQIYNRPISVGIFVGPGNNGGDGWCIGRLLSDQGYNVNVIYDKDVANSTDNQLNKDRFISLGKGTTTTFEEHKLVEDINCDVIVDAIFGIGLDRPLTGQWEERVLQINDYKKEVVSVDIPSGLDADLGKIGTAVNAKHTISFQFPKLSMFFEDYEDIIGQFHIVNIGLDLKSIDKEPTDYYWIDIEMIRSLWTKRKPSSHKGDYGRACIIAGGKGMMGAAVLSAEAALRSGIGLLEVHVPQKYSQIIHLSNPEAMVSEDVHYEHFSHWSDQGKIFAVISVGPGLGKASQTSKGLRELLDTSSCPLVIDADALNIIAEKNWLSCIPKGSILTPHPGEFDRLFGEHLSDRERWEKQVQVAIKHKIYILLKGRYTKIVTPTGTSFFNSTGNPGLSMGGSGDILTGIITGLIGRLGDPFKALIVACFVHGRAADFCKDKMGLEGWIGRDVISFLPFAFKNIDK